MSRFVKVTSILGIAAISFGVWQLSQQDSQANIEASPKETISEHSQTYQRIHIDKEEAEEQKVSVRAPVDARTVRSFKEAVEKQKEVKVLVEGVGEPEGKEEPKWSDIEKDSKEKMQLLDKLTGLSDNDIVEEFAKKANHKLERALDSKQAAEYIETVELFHYISEQL
ncbi:hypothetical protein QRD89_04865 [Halobacillus sp. ACCC02827]|uniref:hypothetical protein n=1 Tax=unclassified Halobacillus TaxID=2636472 RepID=UPI0002A51C83|nr:MULTISPECIES: hypothetical protein [unclassified Halobacillus]ELK47559.1 hypothetical protein D479_05650 [Halobacillus sp. BAB-2008]WJE16679.1 hypothetical protein QRD89_04865 [Halobacillus sp. ACCC02827]